MKLRGAEIAEVTWRSHRSQLEMLRTLVFIEEQAVPVSDEWDGLDELSIHFIATNREQEPIGCVRLTPSGQIGRLAVLVTERGQGIARLLMEAVIRVGLDRNLGPLHLHAQRHAVKLYLSLGFAVTGQEFMDAGIPHVPMELKQDANRSDRLATYTLGEAELSPRHDTVLEVDLEAFTQQVTDVSNLGLGEGLAEGLGFSRSTAHDYFLLCRDDEVLGGAILAMTGEIIFLSGNVDDGAARLLINAIIAKAIRYRWTSLFMSRRVALPSALASEWQTSKDDATRLELPIDSNPKHLHPIYRDENHEPALAETTMGSVDHNFWFSNHERLTELIRHMTKQAQREVLLHSPSLLSEWAFNDDVCLELSRLARSHGSTRVYILVWEAMPLIQHNAPLLELSRKLSSSVQIKQVSPALQNHPGEFAVFDQTGLVLQQNPHHPIGWANFRAIAKAREKRRLFMRLWENGLTDANLRQMHI